MRDGDTVHAPRAAGDQEVFDGLVIGEADIVGLLSYAIYIQFKDEWAAEFRRKFGRAPDTHELAVYELGEQTARRKVTYRFLADSRLTGKYDKGQNVIAGHSFVQRAYEKGAKAAINAKRPWTGYFPVLKWGLAILLTLSIGAAVSVGRAGFH